MGCPRYSAVIYLLDGSDFAFPAAVEACRSWLPESRVEKAGEKEMELYFEDWCLKVAVQDEPFVAEENREFAEASPGYSHAEEIARCRRRLYVWSMDEDPNGDHFNDYLLAVQSIVDTFRGLIAIDEASDEPF
jgi:hypothetical protein